MKLFATFLLFLVSTCFVIAQENELQNLLQRAEQYQFSNPDSSFILAKKLRKNALEESDSIYLGESERVVGVYFQLQGRLDSAGTHFQRAYDYYSNTQDTTRLTRVIISLALVDISKGDYEEALAKLILSQEYAEAIGRDDYRLRSIGEVARIYSLQGDHERSIEQSRYYYNEVKDGDDLRQKSVALSYLSVEFMHFREFDSSLYYLNKNLELEQQNPVSNPTSLGAIHQNIASVYNETQQSDLALKNFEAANGYFKRAGYLIGIAQVNLNLAILLSKNNNNIQAKDYIEEGISGAEVLGDLHLLREMYRLQSFIYENLGSYDKSLMSFKKFKSMNDSIFNMDKQGSINELLTQYEVAQKEQQIELQQAQLVIQESKLQRNQLFIISLFLGIALSIVIFVLLRIRARKNLLIERQESKTKLREAEINAIINSQEKERNRFARDLHDGFGQLISVLKLNLSQLGETSAKDAEKRFEVYKNGESVINEMYAELRNICFDLMPQTLVKRGLMPALREFGARVNQTDKVNCEVLVFANNERLSELVEISLFRITQEWVNNILKYAKADNITIQLTHEDGEAILTIEDNGGGFDPQIFYHSTGNGWKNIQTRLNQIKGEFDLDSRPGISGTMMTVLVKTRGFDKRIPTGTEEELTA